MDVRFLRSAYLSWLIISDVYRIREPLFVGFVDSLGRNAIDNQECAVAAHVVVYGSLLPWDLADGHQLVVLGPLDYVPLIPGIGVADASLECWKIDLESG